MMLINHTIDLMEIDNLIDELIPDVYSLLVDVKNVKMNQIIRNDDNI